MLNNVRKDRPCSATTPMEACSAAKQHAKHPSLALQRQLRPHRDLMVMRLSELDTVSVLRTTLYREGLPLRAAMTRFDYRRLSNIGARVLRVTESTTSLIWR